MSIVLQISDPHFGAERQRVVDALVALEHRMAPDLVVVSGDVTQRARRSQFAAARRFMQRLHAPATLAIPGNHDLPLFNLWARIFAPYANYQRVFGQALEPVFECSDLLVVGINSTRPYRHKHGEISERQIDEVCARLQARKPGQLCMVVAHHPVHVITDHDVDNLVRGHGRAARAWVAAGADLIVGGHIHLPFVRPVQDMDGSLAGDAWVVQAGTAVSTRVRSHAPNSVNVIRYRCDDGQRTCLVERWDYIEQTSDFEQVQETALMRDGVKAVQL